MSEVLVPPAEELAGGPNIADEVFFTSAIRGISAQLDEMQTERIERILRNYPWIRGYRYTSSDKQITWHFETEKIPNADETAMLQKKLATESVKPTILNWSLGKDVANDLIKEKLGSEVDTVVQRHPLENELFVVLLPDTDLSTLEPSRLDLSKSLNRKVVLISPPASATATINALRSQESRIRNNAIRSWIRENRSRVSTKETKYQATKRQESFRGFKSCDIQSEIRLSAPESLTLFGADLYSVALKLHSFDVIKIRGTIDTELEYELKPWIRKLARRFGAYVVYERSEISPAIHRKLCQIAESDGVIRDQKALEGPIAKIIGQREPNFALGEITLPPDLLDQTSVEFISFDRSERTPDKDDIQYAEFLGPLGPNTPIRERIVFADAAWLIGPNSPVAKYAQKVSSTIYGPKRAVPVLGSLLSFDLLSLEPNKERVGLVVDLVIGGDGEIIKSDFYRAKVMSHASYDMDDALGILADKKHVHHKSVLALAEAARRLRRKRLSESLFVSPVFSEGVGQRLVEEAMIASKHYIASRLANAKIPALFRVQAEISLPERKEFIRRIRAANIKVSHRDFAEANRLKGLLLRLDRVDATNLVNDILNATLVNARHVWYSGRHKSLRLQPYLQFKALRTFVGLVNQWYAYSLLKIPGIGSISVEKRNAFQRSISRKARAHSALSGALAFYERLQLRLADCGASFHGTVTKVSDSDVRMYVEGFEKPVKVFLKSSICDAIEVGQQLTATFDGYDTNEKAFRFIY